MTHTNPIQCILNTPTYQSKISTSMIKIDYHDCYVVVLPDEMPNFITNYRLTVISLHGTYVLYILYVNFILILK